MVRSAINTGTWFTLNQMSARRIRDITGVERIVTRIGCKKALNLSCMPARIPSDKARMKDIIKPINPLKIVDPILLKNSGSVMSCIRVSSVFSGGGRIKSEETSNDPAFHSKSKNNTEMTV